MASLLIFGVLVSCKHGSGNKGADPSQSVDYTKVQAPTFNADSAYQYVADQLAFGYRIPGTEAHKKCAAYLVSKMGQWCDTVIVQEFSTRLWNGQTVRGKNIIASIDPQNQQRIVLGAHWDSRMWADHDPDESNWKKPLMGANDGASGVGALMEMARVMSAQRPSVGIDFIFFDVEDQGYADWADDAGYEEDSWCKGSQYWAQHLHTPYYRAVYGVLFDMVGTKEPRFTKEEVSRSYASGVMDKMWNVASSLGYGNVFVNQATDAILDDHLYVNQMANIPMLDIVQNTDGCSFFEYWHTVGDNLDAIDKNSLKVVADVTMATIYADYSSK